MWNQPVGNRHVYDNLVTCMLAEKQGDNYRVKDEVRALQAVKHTKLRI